MRALYPLLVVATLAGVTRAPVIAQSSNTTEAAVGAGVRPDSGVVEVLLPDGSVLAGRIVGDTTEIIRLQLLSGDVIELRRGSLREVRPLVGRVVNGRVWRRDPNATRLFFAPTGRSLSSGQGYISVYELVVPFLALGVTDRVTLAAGTPLVFGGGGERVFWIAPKLQVARTDRLAASVGVLHFFSTSDVGGLGIAYGVATVGTGDDALTAGVGYGYAEGELSRQPVLMLGGEVRSGRSIKLITENYVLPGEGALLSGGIRFFGERLTADLGLAVPTGGDEVIALPLVDFVYNW